MFKLLKKRFMPLILLFATLLSLTACNVKDVANTVSDVVDYLESVEYEEDVDDYRTGSDEQSPADLTPAQTETPIPAATQAPTDTPTASPTKTQAITATPTPTAPATLAPTNTPKPTATLAPTNTPIPTIDEHGSYTSKDDVALYIHTYGKLPENFITKKEAEALGWSGGSLEPYAPGKCIGGSSFGNYEGLLPKKKGRKYTECDIDTLGKKSRGAKRIVFSNDGLIYYTDDHYESFTLLYGEP